MRCHSDWSVYTHHSPTASTMSATSVDDIILASDSHAESLHASAEINHKFAITDTRDTGWILSCRITHNWAKCSLIIDQVISSITGTESGEVFLDRLLGLGHMIPSCMITCYDDAAD